MRVWQTLGDPPPKTLHDARLLAHHALGVVQSYGRSLLLPPGEG